MSTRDIKYLKGIGENRAKMLNRLGINSVCALLHFYPRDWRDYTEVTTVVSAVSDRVCAVMCKVISQPKAHFVRQNMVLYKFTAVDKTGILEVTIFNDKYTAQKIKKGESYVFYGKISGYGVNRTMSSPEIVNTENAVITPIYALTAGLYQTTLRNAVKEALKLPLPTEYIPQNILSQYGLCNLEYALKNIHFPENSAALQSAQKRLVFGELLLFRLGIAYLRRTNLTAKGKRIEKSHIAEFKNLLPFTLTDGQEKAITDCETDMLSGRQMNRLIEGDVGSGKTAVAAALMYTVAKNGMQCAMMAPTEILAEQHFKTLKKLFSGTDITVELLVGSLGLSAKKEIKAKLKSGEIDIIVGTQALIQGDVAFCNLCLAVTDEQHRFGVKQRTTLNEKGQNPHVLVMSATPIPRTLALIMYGDLDISILQTLPKGRQPTETYCVTEELRPRIYNFIKKHIAAGQRAYIVCPMIEENEQGFAAAKEYYEKISREVFTDCKVGLLHGKMSAREKEEVMRSFASGATKVLVATTVVEVGVDVPDATVMVIENAERYGLSQLHQLRGRVGRGTEKSTCILVTAQKDPKKNERLNILAKNSDGFKIADYDLKLRGPGDFLGNRQHGLPQFKIADISCNLEELAAAGNAADKILAQDPQLKKAENLKIKNEMKKLFDNNIGLN